MYDFLLPHKTRKHEKENEIAKMVLNVFFSDPFNFHLCMYNKRMRLSSLYV